MRLPVTIVSGYLGAGKTTLINRLLSEEHGLRILVIVNDFGAINIDAALIEETGETTIELSNGCICCSIEADLFTALNAALDRNPRPDHVIIETSGIADPAAVASAILTEREMSYGGIVTLIDAVNGPGLLSDPEMVPQLLQQIKSADLNLITKSDGPAEDLFARLKELRARNVMDAKGFPLSSLLFDITPLPLGQQPKAHTAYTRWHHESDRVLSRAALGDKLNGRPAGLYRLKGFIQTDAGGYEVHIVGQHVEAKRAPCEGTSLVGLGLSSRISAQEIEAWWQSTG